MFRWAFVFIAFCVVSEAQKVNFEESLFKGETKLIGSQPRAYGFALGRLSLQKVQGLYGLPPRGEHSTIRVFTESESSPWMYGLTLSRIQKNIDTNTRSWSLALIQGGYKRSFREVSTKFLPWIYGGLGSVGIQRKAQVSALDESGLGAFGQLSMGLTFGFPYFSVEVQLDKLLPASSVSLEGSGIQLGIKRSF